MPENLGQHRPGELVRRARSHDRAAGEFMQVGAANSASERFDHDLGVAHRGRRRDIFDPNVLFAVKSDRLHRLLHFSSCVYG